MGSHANRESRAIVSAPDLAGPSNSSTGAFAADVIVEALERFWSSNTLSRTQPTLSITSAKRRLAISFFEFPCEGTRHVVVSEHLRSAA